MFYITYNNSMFLLFQKKKESFNRMHQYRHCARATAGYSTILNCIVTDETKSCTVGGVRVRFLLVARQPGTVPHRDLFLIVFYSIHNVVSFLTSQRQFINYFITFYYKRLLEFSSKMPI